MDRMQQRRFEILEKIFFFVHWSILSSFFRMLSIEFKKQLAILFVQPHVN